MEVKTYGALSLVKTFVDKIKGGNNENTEQPKVHPHGAISFVKGVFDLITTKDDACSDIDTNKLQKDISSNPDDWIND